jgi:hypothetical protein
MKAYLACLGFKTPGTVIHGSQAGQVEGGSLAGKEDKKEDPAG